MTLEDPGIYPQPGPQTKFLECPADIAIYGGAAGSGKSYAILMDSTRCVGRPGFAGVVFRRVSTSLTGAGSIWEESGDIYRRVGGDPKTNPHIWNFPSGASIQFSHLQYDKDAEAHRGRSYAAIYFEELTEFTESQFWKLVGRNRTTCGIRPFVRCTTNPDPDSFVRRLIDWWIGDDGLPIEERSGVIRWFRRMNNEVVWYDELPDDPLALSFTFISAKLSDNKILETADPTYRAKLEAMPLVEREKMLGGNWDIRPSAGLYFQRSYFDSVDDSPGPVMRRVRAWDKAGTRVTSQSPDPDWTAGVRLALLRDGRWVVEDVETFRDGPHGVEQRIRRVADSDPKGTVVTLWQDPGQAGKADVDNMRRALVGHTVRVHRASKDKVTYAGPFSSQCEGGNVLIKRGPWNERFFNETTAFPDGKHDDVVDACSLAFLELSNNALTRFRLAAN